MPPAVTREQTKGFSLFMLEPFSAGAATRQHQLCGCLYERCSARGGIMRAATAALATARAAQMSTTRRNAWTKA
jgi:hypothetical protein